METETAHRTLTFGANRMSGNKLALIMRKSKNPLFAETYFSTEKEVGAHLLHANIYVYSYVFSKIIKNTIPPLRILLMPITSAKF